MRTQRKFIMAGVFALLAIIEILLLRTVDVAAIGPEGTQVGLSHLNGAVHGALGFNAGFFTVSKLLGYAALLLAGLFAALGVFQLIRRRSLEKVDRQLIALCGLYAAVLLVYLLFEKVVVNCRPVIVPGDAAPEPSFPSSHTMLACTILGSAMMVTDHFVRGRTARKAIKWACGIGMAAIIVTRLLSGVHWLTDIVGGLLISAALLCLFSAALDKLCPPRKGGKKRRKA